MKRIFFILMAVSAIAMTGAFTGCDEEVEPFPGENIPSRLDTTPPQTEIDGRRVNAPMVIPEAE